MPDIDPWARSGPDTSKVTTALAGTHLYSYRWDGVGWQGPQWMVVAGGSGAELYAPSGPLTWLRCRAWALLHGRGWPPAVKESPADL